MSKTYTSAMRCAVCRRPITKAAALRKGLPVGPTCAINVGLIQPHTRQLSLDMAASEAALAHIPDTDTMALPFDV